MPSVSPIAGPPSGGGGSPREGLTFRSILLGLGCVVLVCWASLYSNMVQKSSYLAGTLMSVAVVFTFMLVVLVVNPLLKLVRRGWGLSRAELVVVFTMTLLATFLPTFGWGQSFFPPLLSYRYYADPINDWEQTLLPHIDGLRVPLMPSRDTHAVEHFFTGLPPDQSVPRDIPWGAWLGPLAWWFSFFLPLFFLLMCIAVVFRKQWVERERLPFPLLQLPMEIVQSEDRGRLFNGLFRNPLLWAGFALPVLFDAFASFGYVWGAFPMVRYRTTLDLTPFYSVRLDPNWVMMGFTYFINLHVAFSLWFFAFLRGFTGAAMGWMGWSLGRGEYYSANEPALMHFSMGAVAVMAGLAVWGARDHLRDVFRRAFKGAKDVDDSAEVLSYRSAVLGGLACFVWLWVWLCMIGMQWWLPPLFMAIALAIFMAVTIVVIQGGVPTATASHIPQAVIPNLLGTSALTQSSIVAMGVSFTWISDIRVILLPFFAHCVRLADRVKMRRRNLSWIMMLTMFAGLVATTVTIFWLAYEAGGINLNHWFFVNNPQRGPRYAHEFITNPVTWQGDNMGARWAWTAWGGLAFAGLTFLRHRFVWWPLHPIGMPFMFPSWPVVMLTWMVKGLILKYGGVRLFAQLKPVFLGFILGQFGSAGTWFILDMLLGVVGHVIYNR